ncbi:MAG: Gfo/Idh/MocA family oxidoreductase [Pirellulales bacterium]|nr:Gfo/Idh/MocA family oxidoreductase [Pirellulales bacterium]
MKILIIGLGGIGQRHTRNIRALLGDNVEIIAYRTRGLSHVVTPTLGIEDGAHVETRYNLKVFTDLDKALAEKPNVAFICNPSSCHVEVARKAAAASCDLFIEKPVSHTLEGLNDLAQVVGKQSLVTFVAYQLRYNPGVRYLKSLLESGKLGNILAVNAEVGEHLPSWHKYEDYRIMYASRKNLGGGVILSQIHEMDFLYHFFGLPVSIYAVGGHLSELEVDVEDTASILMKVNWEGRPIPIHIHQDYLQQPPRRTCRIIGDAGKAELDFHAGTVVVHGTDGKVADKLDFSDMQRNDMFMNELKHFFDCVASRETTQIPLEAGVASLRMALAAKESLETGQPVELTP